MTNRKGYIVEFTGLAGCGKTYIKNLLSEKLKADNIICDASLACSKFISPLIYLKLFIYSLCLLISTKPKSFFQFYEGMKVWLNTQLLYARIRDGGGLLIIDEGIVHKFRGLRRASKYDNLLMKDIKKSIMEKLYLADLVVLVEADSKDIIERRKKRDGRIIENIDEAISRVNFTKDDISTLVKLRNIDSFVLNNSSRITCEAREQLLDDLCVIIKNNYGFTY